MTWKEDILDLYDVLMHGEETEKLELAEDAGGHGMSVETFEDALDSNFL